MTEEYQPAPNGFINLIQETCAGLLEEELDQELMDLVKLARARGTKGKITLSFTLDPIEKHEDAFKVSTDLKVTTPKRAHELERRFADASGGLTTEDPNQPSIFGSATSN